MFSTEKSVEYELSISIADTFPICENLILNGIITVGKSAEKVCHKLRRMEIRC